MIAASEHLTSIGTLKPEHIAVHLYIGTGRSGMNLEHPLTLDLEARTEPIARSKKCQNNHRNDNRDYHNCFRNNNSDVLPTGPRIDVHNYIITHFVIISSIVF